MKVHKGMERYERNTIRLMKDLENLDVGQIVKALENNGNDAFHAKCDLKDKM
jgi:hypothetical protein